MIIDGSCQLAERLLFAIIQNRTTSSLSVMCQVEIEENCLHQVPECEKLSSTRTYCVTTAKCTTKRPIPH